MRNIIAEVEVPGVIPLEEMAGKLGAIINGVFFEREETGYFEEVPAFVAKDVNSGMSFILFGIPEGEICDAYTLECSVETDLPIQEFRKKTLGLINRILIDKEVNSRGYFDYSDELANALTRNGIMASKSSP